MVSPTVVTPTLQLLLSRIQLLVVRGTLGVVRMSAKGAKGEAPAGTHVPCFPAHLLLAVSKQGAIDKLTSESLEDDLCLGVDS